LKTRINSQKVKKIPFLQSLTVFFACGKNDEILALNSQFLILNS